MDCAVLTFSSNQLFPKPYGEKLRGFFSNIYKDLDLFHNHAADGKSLYRYPLIQYKVIDGNLTVLGLKEATKLVMNEFVKHGKLKLGGEIFDTFETNLTLKQVNFEVIEKLNSYHFDSVWLPLNEKNYRRYLKGDLDLNVALQNNLLSDLKGLGITAQGRIMVKGRFKKREVILENKKMLGFVGNFVCNMQIPRYIGTGKRKSIGFGTILGSD